MAYRNWKTFRKAPDFTNTKFVHPYDFVANNPFPLDREGHGTFVAGILGESTNNHVGLAGIAYGASIMPVPSSTPMAPATPRRSPREFATPPTTARRSSTSASSST